MILVNKDLVLVHIRHVLHQCGLGLLSSDMEAVRNEAAEVEAQVADISIAALPGEVSAQTNLTTRM